MVEAVDDRGAILTDAISAGASTDLTKDFTTVHTKIHNVHCTIILDHRSLNSDLSKDSQRCLET